ncbi:hypothetical protein JCM3766R1_006204 [Sporobolomyces carnicolor]
MDTAQNAFSSRCIDLSFSAYCSAPWQVSPEQACCGICPSPAINAYGTLIGLAIASFFNLLIVLFRPASSAIYICGQLMLGNMFVVAVAVRNSMGTLSEGTNAIQKWHAEFAFLLASSSCALIVACVLSDVHFIHGFARQEHLHQFQFRKAISRKRVTPTPHVVGAPTHRLFRRHRDSAWQRVRKLIARRQAYILFGLFSGTQLFWFVVYATTIWWGESTAFWQPQCDDLIGPANYAILTGVSWVFASLGFLSSILLSIPVFASVSASEFLVRAFHLSRRHRSNPDINLRLRLKVQNHIKRGKLDRTVLSSLHVESKAERMIKIVLSLTVWLFWFASLLIIFFKALQDFLLIGTAWPYAGIQNLLFGCFPLVRFLMDPFRRFRGRHGLLVNQIRRRKRTLGPPSLAL